MSALGEALEILTNRLHLYNFLSQVYLREIDIDFLAQIACRWRSVDGSSTLSPGSQILGEFARGLDGADLRMVRRRLAVDYAGLFLSAREQHTPPYESVYTSPDRLLMQRAQDEVAQIYLQENLLPPADLREPADHIGLELAFMSFLCEKTIEAVERGEYSAALHYLRRQRAFLDQHLLIWGPAFCAELRNSAQTAFYKGVSLLTEEYLRMENPTVDELIHTVETDGSTESNTRARRIGNYSP